jgi:hypothetical protein
VRRPVVLDTLGKMLESHDAWCHCDACQRGALLDPKMLLERLGPDYPINRFRTHCGQCGLPGRVSYPLRYHAARGPLDIDGNPKGWG